MESPGCYQPVAKHDAYVCGIGMGNGLGNSAEGKGGMKGHWMRVETLSWVPSGQKKYKSGYYGTLKWVLPQQILEQRVQKTTVNDLWGSKGASGGPLTNSN